MQKPTYLEGVRDAVSVGQEVQPQGTVWEGKGSIIEKNLPGQKSGAAEVQGPSGEATAVVWLSAHELACKQPLSLID